MIPMQATCFASLDEIQQTVRALLNQTLAGLLSQKPKDATAPSFCVQIKRRNCSSVTRDDLISAVVAVVDDATAAAPWTVNLREADYTFQIEICKTLTGVSILPASFSKEQRNFNLAEIREKVGVAAE
jgi:tRNA(Ser,Leu) C12 N-acetylase TAN1